LLQENRLPAELARGEHFDMIVHHLWMSAPRWWDLFREVGHTPPSWFTALCRTVHVNGKPFKAVGQLNSPELSLKPTEQKVWRAKPGEPLTPAQTAVLSALNNLWPNGDRDYKATGRDRRIGDWLRQKQQIPVSPRTIQRALKKIEFA
jgi:hypothetical protein